MEPSKNILIRAADEAQRRGLIDDETYAAQIDWLTDEAARQMTNARVLRFFRGAPRAADTLEIAEELAAAEDARYSTPAKRGPRPKGRSERLMLYLSPEEKAALEAYSEREGIPLAEAVRRALKRLK